MDTDQATIVTAWATIGQALSAITMIGFSVWTAYLTRKQTKNAQLQTQNMELQTKKM